MRRQIRKLIDKDGVDRRGFLECMAWAGTGMLWAVSGGVARSQAVHEVSGSPGAFNFVQISDSHMGFSKEANTDVAGTLRTAVERINALPSAPAFVIHTGDITHLSKPEEYDQVDNILKAVKTGEILYVPGEHDVFSDQGKQYLARHGKNAVGSGWFSFDMKGVHFIGLVNVLELRAGGLGALSREQLEWLARDLDGRGDSTPIVVFAHVPLWTVYADWGWGTEDGLQALSYLRRFGSVTVLNGHIHQTLQKVEGNMVFHTAASTAFPQPKPGSAPSPGPLTVPAPELRSLLGITDVRFVAGNRSLAVVDQLLEAAASNAAAGQAQVKIENFAFAPSPMSVPPGSRVTWVNHDDLPHNVISTNKAFASPALDTGEMFTFEFARPGEYSYYCSLHPMMQGRVVVAERA
jgi:Icc protein